MSASITDKITNTSNGVRPVSTTVATVRSAGVTTLACNDLTGWPTDTAVHFVTYKVDGQNKIIAGSQTDWKGIVSGTSISNLTATGGTDNGNSVGDIVEALPTARWAKDLTDALRTSLNQDGTLKTAAIPTGSVGATQITNGAITTPKLAAGSTALGWSEFHTLTVPTNTSYAVYNTITATSTGGRVEATGVVHLSDANSGSTRTGHYKIQVDGVDITNSERVWQTAAVNQYTSGTVMASSAPSAGSHVWTFLVQADVANATNILHSTLSVREVA